MSSLASRLRARIAERRASFNLSDRRLLGDVLKWLDLLERDASEAPFREAELLRQLAELRGVLDSPQTGDFLSAVRIEAAHQVARWGSAHDDGKDPADWFWLLGYLAGKALAAAVKGDREKALHHTISSAAVLMNWHRALSGNATSMRPGIANPESSNAS